MDLLMPEKEGIETIIELRNNDSDIKIIVISGTGNENLKMAGLLGAHATFKKPFSIDLLINT